MHPSPRLLACALATTLTAILPGAEEAPDLALDSPDGRIRVAFRLDDEGRATLDVRREGVLVASVALGLDLAGSGRLERGLAALGSRRSVVDTTYSIPVGKAAVARDLHRELIVSLVETSAPGRKLDVAIRAFDDGVAFRYRIPEQSALTDIVLTAERTRLRFPGSPTARALRLDSFTTPYEKHYETLTPAEVAPESLLALPILLERRVEGAGRLWVAVTEADLTDYAGMYLTGARGEPGTLATALSPLPGREDAACVLAKAPHTSPWRVLMVADDPGRLIESQIVFHLNAPSAIEDTSWIRPGKTTFPWWNGYALGDVEFEPGVNTATMLHYIDFCAEQGIPYHSLDGLDIAWYGGPIAPRGPTDVTTAAPSIDLPAILRHAREKGVRIRLWVHWKALKPQIDEAFRCYEEWGIEGVMVDFMDRDDQEMVRFYHEMARKAARHHLTLTLHGSYKPTGMERTWPNVLSYEAALNQEYDKWDERGTPPEHNLDIAFVRMLAGPVDYHQGGMRSVLPASYRHRNRAPPVQGTRAHQLAMYVVYQNHLSMMADYPSAYRGQDGLDFLVDVPASWHDTRVLHAEPGACLVVARRHGGTWYLGGMASKDRREVDLPLRFLSKGRAKVDLWLDDPDRGPTRLRRESLAVASSGSLRVTMPPAGGFVGRITREDVALNRKDDGYRGIWYYNQKSGDEYVYKYSGGLGTYCAKHRPFAVYRPEVDKTFFCFGGTRKGSARKLIHLVSWYDHARHLVPRPTILLDKQTGDAHDNPVISVDDEGYLWVFSTSHGRSRPSWVHRSEEPYSIESFRRIDATYRDGGRESLLDNFSYMQTWHVSGQGFVSFFTRYGDPAQRTNMFMSSRDGVSWSEWRRLAAIDWGHYQISAVRGDKAAAAFNYHPAGKGLNWRTNLYYMETGDLGVTWRSVDGRPLEVPLTEPRNAALVHDYASEGLNVYLKDITFDGAGRPLILFITSKGYQSGPANGPRVWTTARWTGEEWIVRPVTSSDNNYDMGTLHVEGPGSWRVIGPTEPGPQRFNPGGEIAVWRTADAGRSWTRSAHLTSGSEMNHTYARRPVDAHPGFYAIWADGHGRKPSSSRIYFCTRDGDVYRLPETMDSELAEPIRIRAGAAR